MNARLACATLVTAVLGLAFAAPANAETTATVKAQTTQRMNGPNLSSGQDGVYKSGQVLTLVCHTTGEAVKGFFSFNMPSGGWDNLWYKTNDGHYVADIDIETHTRNALGPDCPNGGGGGAPVSAPSGNNGARALAWAREQMAKNPDSSIQCEAFVEEAYDHAFRYPSAIDTFNDLKGKGQIHGNTDNIPAGALVFTSDRRFDQGFGHVMLSEGNGKYLTANYYENPKIREVPLNSNDARDEFLGWAFAP